jgi:hypothetical protein
MLSSATVSLDDLEADHKADDERYNEQGFREDNAEEHIGPQRAFCLGIPANRLECA